jgi:cytochrome c551
MIIVFGGENVKQSWAIFAIMLLFLSGCSSSTSSSDNTGDAIYTKTCAACHGDKLQGMTGPTLVNIKSKYSEADIEKIISQGTQHMPANLVADEQSKIVTKWLLTK